MPNFKASGAKLDAISRLLRSGMADGSIYIERDYDFDPCFDIEAGPWKSSRRNRTRITIEIDLYGTEMDFLDEIVYDPIPARPSIPTPTMSTLAAAKLWIESRDISPTELEITPEKRAVEKLVKILTIVEEIRAMRRQHEKAAVCWNIFAEIVKTIQKAWVMDDTSKRFRMLELD